MKQAILVIDLGGHSRVILVGTDGKILSVFSEDSQYLPDAAYPAGWYADTAQWEDLVIRGTRQVLAEAGDVKLLAVTSTSQREGIVLLDKEGKAITAYPNADMRGVQYIGGFDWAKINQITCLTPLPLYDGQKLYAIARQDPELLEKIGAITSISDWVGYLFTGELVWEKSQAIHSSVYDIHNDCWSEELAEYFGFPAGVLPKLGDAGAELGRVSDAYAALTGVPAGIPFIIGAADTQAATAGVRAKTGDIVSINGTTTPLMVPVQEIHNGPFWMSPNVLDNKYAIEVNAGNTGVNLDRLLAQFNVGESAAEGFAEIERRFAAGQLPPVMAMYSGNIHAAGNYLPKGCFVTSNSPEPGLDWKDYAYAMILCIAFQQKVAFDAVKEAAGAEGRFIGAGGGFSGDIEAQVLADLTGQELYLFEESRQASVYGCFHLACRALGLNEVQPTLKKVYKPEKFEALEAFYEKWLKLRDAMMPIAHS